MQRIVKDLAKVIGIGDAIIVVAKWGNRDFRVPVDVKEGDPLALTLGMESARKLVKAYGGQSLQLPCERVALLDMRNASIVKAVTPIEQGGQGLSHRAAGLLYGVSRQNVRHILDRAEERGETQTFAGADH